MAWVSNDKSQQTDEIFTRRVSVHVSLLRACVCVCECVCLHLETEHICWAAVFRHVSRQTK